MRGITRRRFLTAAGTASLAGCLGGADGGTSPTSETVSPGSDTAATESSTTTARPWSEASGLPLADHTLPLPGDPAELRELARSGGPGKDGIPSIDDPSFVSPDEADEFLDAGDVVFGVERDDEAKAYPQSILVWHEICNDRIAGDPVSVTYCPLTGTALGFERGETTFGVSGRLLNNNLIMYDRGSETWWPQVLGTAIPGPWNDDLPAGSLREFRVVWSTWEQWSKQYPETQILSRETGHVRNYSQDPYGSYNPKNGYYAGDGTLFDPLEEDERFHPKEIVLGARTAGGAAAFPAETLREEKLLEGSIDDTLVIAVYDTRYDTGYVYPNPTEVAWEFADGEVVDEDGTTHAPDSLPLERLHAFGAMWFAWVGFYPETSVHD